jgi:hypothetical protein
MSMPVEKYHPSIYKNKSKSKNSDSIATFPILEQHMLDIKKKLRQYRRDMAQATAATGRLSAPGQKSLLPSLLPSISPGPVTPMELEENAEYFAGDESEEKRG